MSVLKRMEPAARAGDQEAQIEGLRAIANKNQFSLTKTIRAGVGGKAVVAITPSNIDLSVADTDDGEAVGLSVIGGRGTVIRGPIGITTSPSNIRISGMWALNDAILSCYPSTIMSPIPVVKFKPPLDYMAGFIASAAVLSVFFGAFA